MVDTIYSAMEFYGKGDPYFGGTAADRALYKTEDGGHAFISAADAQRRKLVMAYFPTEVEAEKAGAAASTRKGSISAVPIKPRLEVPTAQISWIVGNKHVGEEDGGLAEDFAERAKRAGAADADLIAQIVAYALACDRENQAVGRAIPALENVWTQTLQPKTVRAIPRRGPQHELQVRKLSRYTVQITNGTTTDEEGTIGYDRPLRTFFLQAFPDTETDECALWLGAFIEEYPTLESIIEAARARGSEVRGLTREMMLAMLKEAGPPHPPSLGERLGIVR